MKFITDFHLSREAGCSTSDLSELRIRAEKKHSELQWIRFSAIIPLIIAPSLVRIIFPHYPYIWLYSLASIFVIGAPVMFFVTYAFYNPRLLQTLKTEAQQDAAANP